MSLDAFDLRVQLEEKLNHPSVPRAQSLWKHYKGAVYRVYCVGVRESTKELEVCYHASESFFKFLWVRPLSEWNEMVTYNGQIF